MKRWVKRVAVTVLAVLLAVGGYGAWRLGHPAMPEGTQTLPAASRVPDGLTAQYFGTTTLVFRQGRDAVMIDALLSRPGLGNVLFGKLASDSARIEAILRRAGLSRLGLLLVSHTHYDHSLDLAAIAARAGATVAGSTSTGFVAQGGGIPSSRIRTIRGGETLNAGAIRVTVIRSLHSLDDRIPGVVTAPLRQPAGVADYKEGGSFAFLIEHRGTRILVHPSANFVPGMYRGIRADAVFLATGGLSAHPPEFTQRYWRETVTATGAKLVMPIHWDDFLEPLDRPLQPLRRFMDDIPLTMTRIAPLAARDGVPVAYMPVIAPVDIASLAKGLTP
ncbi:MBL fold metallo-hydrolase [Sphingomonas sp. MG17]|uniref:MBL fold metallo-hydrolase n=1 Tax=Sphingomonas tagetis TaxID=2949092 RepID=A0A9X2HR16_9SPHN|nr:MBL fold metallo-hydrolase [Sphingomonas tagetis]MCP3731015.1 MBL fold metallo-hydrolase [Sphingomonas tagetis]